MYFLNVPESKFSVKYIKHSIVAFELNYINLRLLWIDELVGVHH